MARIDIKTLVTVFEKRIAELEKNPPEIPMAVVVNLLSNAVDDAIREHFMLLVKKDVEEAIKNEYSMMHEGFIANVMEEVFFDKEFRKKIQNHIKNKMLLGFEK
jgi:hypothetical protein